MRNLTGNSSRIAALFALALLLLAGSHVGAEAAATEPLAPDAPSRSERAFKVKRPVSETDELRREIARLKAENEALRLKLENATLRTENEMLRRELAEAGHKAITPATPPKPHLVITDIFQDGPYYINVKYKNTGGPGSGDFLIKVTSRDKSFLGNSIYRFPVPASDQEVTTGGFTMGLIGVHADMEADVTAEIDWEHRVDQSDRSGNIFTKHLILK